MHSNSPIGIFDSGIGGLTVFHAIRRLLPQESLCYLGDTARVPYGTKSAETVKAYSRQNAQWLMQRGVKAVVVACNTSSAVALTELQSTLQMPVIGMIAPGADAAITATRNGRVGVIGTPRTILSGAYREALHARNPKISVLEQACPLLVPLAEEGLLSGDIPRLTLERYLAPLLGKVDTLILGCTHYPLLSPLIQSVMGDGVALIDSGEAAAAELVCALKGICADGTVAPRWDCFVTDMPQPFTEVAQRFLNPLPQIHHVHLE